MGVQKNVRYTKTATHAVLSTCFSYGYADFCHHAVIVTPTIKARNNLVEFFIMRSQLTVASEPTSAANHSKKSFVSNIILAAALGLSAQLALADDAAPAGEALAQKGGCLMCHTVQKRNVGPALKDIAAVYKGQDVEDKLVEKIKKGGRGSWGILPMPPNEGKLTDDEFRQVVRWIRTL